MILLPKQIMKIKTFDKHSETPMDLDSEVNCFLKEIGERFIEIKYVICQKNNFGSFVCSCLVVYSEDVER